MEFAEQASQERACRFGISVALQQGVEHDPVLVHGSTAAKHPHAVKRLLGAALTKMGAALQR
ncbi:hypothetical protein ACVWZX_004069 [Deinococcus sp. UYEF24]